MCISQNMINHNIKFEQKINKSSGPCEATIQKRIDFEIVRLTFFFQKLSIKIIKLIKCARKIGFVSRLRPKHKALCQTRTRNTE